MPKSEQDARREGGLPLRLGRDGVMHEREEVCGLVLDLNVYVKLDVTILGLSLRFRRWNGGAYTHKLYLHEEVDGLFECCEGLLGLFDGPQSMHSALAMPQLLPDQA